MAVSYLLSFGRGSKNTSHRKWYYISALSITLHKTKTASLMLAKVSCISWVIGLLTLSGGLFAQGKWDQEPPDLNRAEWKRLRSLRKVRPLFWIGPLRNKAVYGICLTPLGFREHYNAVVNGLNLEVLGIGTLFTTFHSIIAPFVMAESFDSMDTIPEAYNFQVNGISLGSGFVQRGVLNGIGVGGGLIGKLNGISVGVVNLMYRANGLVIGDVGNAIAEMRGLETALFNVVAFRMHGVQVALIVNEVRFRMRGVQVALFGNVVSNDPILKDSLPNKEKELIDLQVGGINVVSFSALGMQIGLLNRVHGEHEGIQIGLGNMGNTLQGMQISVAINSCGTLQGVQIGLVNECSSLRGVQIGLLNFCEGRLSPFLRVKLKDRRLTTSEPSSESLPRPQRSFLVLASLSKDTASQSIQSLTDIGSPYQR